MTSDVAHIHDPSFEALQTQQPDDRTQIPVPQKIVDPLPPQRIVRVPQQPESPLSQPTEPPDSQLSAPPVPSLAVADRATKMRRILLAAVVTLGIGVIGLKAMGVRSANSGLGTFTTSPSASLLTEDLVRLLSDTTNATRVVGSYVPGVGIVISLTVSGVPADALSQWWSTSIAPIAVRIGAELPNDRIVVLVQSPGSGGFARTIVLPTGSVPDITSYRLASAISKDPATLDPATLDSATFNSASSDVSPIDSYSAKVDFASNADNPDTTDKSDNADNANTPPVNPDTANAETAPPALTAPVVATAETTTTPPVASQQATASTEVLEGFDKASAKWTPMSGQWKFLSGSYQQVDNSGFDFISQYTDILPTDFTASVKLAAIEGDINGGLLLFQQAPGKRNGATIIDLTSSSTYLRWGHFDLGGVYVFDGGAKILAPVDQAAGVVLKVEVRRTSAVVFLNDARIGEFAPTKKGGTAGLISSQAKIKFDDFTIRPLQ